MQLERSTRRSCCSGDATSTRTLATAVSSTRASRLRCAPRTTPASTVVHAARRSKTFQTRPPPGTPTGRSDAPRSRTRKETGVRAMSAEDVEGFPDWTAASSGGLRRRQPSTRLTRRTRLLLIDGLADYRVTTIGHDSYQCLDAVGWVTGRASGM